MKRVLSLSLMVIFILVWSIPATAGELEDTQKEKRRIDSIIKGKEQLIKTIQDQLKDQRYLKSQAEEEEERTKLALELKEEEKKQLEDEIKSLDDAINTSQENYFKKQELLKTRLKVMYENSNRSILEILLESKDLGDFFSRLELVALIARKDTELLDTIKMARQDLDSKMSMRVQEKGTVSVQASELSAEINKLTDKISRSSEAIRDYSSEMKTLERQMDQLQAESEQLASDIQSLMTKGSKYAGGEMAWPAKGSTSISSQYGMRYHPILKKKKMHTGIDIPAGSGTSILAANSGKVIVASWQTGYGNTVIIDHGGGIATLYGHCSKFVKKVGDKVTRGEVIAKVGSTGWSTGPHLHFEVIKDGKTVDPTSYLK